MYRATRDEEVLRGLISGNSNVPNTMRGIEAELRGDVMLAYEAYDEAIGVHEDDPGSFDEEPT